MFWSTVKTPLFDKGNPNKKIIVIEDNTIISNDAKVAETMNNYFTNAIKQLQINEFKMEIVSD